MLTNTQLPSLAFDTDDYRPGERMDAMNAFSRGLYEYAPQEGAENPSLKLQAWALDGIAAATFQNSPVIARASGKAGSDQGEHLFLRIIRHGRVPAKSGDDEALLLPGKVHLMHASNTLMPTEPGSVLSLRLPYQSVGYDPSFHPRFLSFSLDKWIGRVVNTAVLSLFEALPTMTVGEARNVTPTLTTLVREMLGTAPRNNEADTGFRDTRDQAMKTYVRENLADTSLDAQRLQSVFNASRATVYRAFERDGGVTRFVREERLAAVHDDLQSAKPHYGMVRQIAEKYGFEDQSTFVKAFRRRYGIRPSDVIGSGRFKRQAKRQHGSESPQGAIPSLASFWLSEPTPLAS